MGVINRQMYHTQEKRPQIMLNPAKCIRTDAWLGSGYYFWADIIDAMSWGRKSKTATGKFEIYEALIKSDNILDTVFNEQEYYFWLKILDKIGKRFLKAGGKATLKDLNDFFLQHNTWMEIDGILFQDIPKKSIISGFYYRKRIQFAAFDLKVVNNFTLNSTNNC